MRLSFIERTLSKAQSCIFMTNLPFRQITKNILLTLGSTTRHLVSRLHCGLATCIQHRALATSRSLIQGYSL